MVNAGIGRGARVTALTPGKELYTQWLALLARASRPGRLPGRLANAIAGGLSCGLWGWTTSVVAGPAAGLGAAALLALWPSHVFHTSLAIKEAPIALLLAVCAACLCGGFGSQGRRRHLLFAAAASSALALAFLRTYLLPLLAMAAAMTSLATSREGRLASILAALWLGAALTAYRPLKQFTSSILDSEGRAQASQIIPILKADGQSPEVPPRFSLAGMAAYRQALLAGSRNWSLAHYNHSPESILFPDLTIEGWSDLAFFLPKASFYELFMPLPGLYPTDGKPGRMLAAAEGVLLLLVFIVAGRGLVRLGASPSTVFLAAFFLLAVPPTAFLEFDLGSASRHRIHYFPFILPFAAAAVTKEKR